jgi:hypothetical protein
MMSPLLNEMEAEPLKELIQFMRGVRNTAQLTRRKWAKPAPRYLHIWNWIVQYERSERSRTSPHARFVITRSSVSLHA